MGTDYSRFKSLNLSVSGALNQLSSKKNVYNIKTPLGSYSTLVFMVILITLTISGLFSSDDVLYDGPLAHLTPNHTFYWVRIHDYSHYILYCLISLHIIAILYYQKVKKHNLIKRMFGFYYKIDQHISSKNNETPLKGVFILLICTILPSLFLILTN
jgi:cytochrome b